MANQGTTQCAYTISIPREKFLNKIVRNEYLTKKAMRVALYLMTELEYKDYRKINLKVISTALNMKKKDINEAIELLIAEGILDYGSSRIVEDGYKLLV